jgi:hypothetical protein
LPLPVAVGIHILQPGLKMARHSIFSAHQNFSIRFMGISKAKGCKACVDDILDAYLWGMI